MSRPDDSTFGKGRSPKKPKSNTRARDLKLYQERLAAESAIRQQQLRKDFYDRRAA